MKISIPFTPRILNSDMQVVYINSFHAKPFDIITYFEIKCIFGETINQLENVFLGTFGKSFNLNKDDEKLFSQLYPYVYEKLVKAYGENGLTVLSKGLDTFRNFNMHASSSDTYLKSFNELVKLVKLLPNYSKSIVYHADNKLTFAGMLVIILLLSNEMMIKYLIKNHTWENFIEHLRLFDTKREYVNTFTKKLLRLSQVNYMIDIRKDSSENDDIIETIFGRFKNKVIRDGDKFKYFSGRDEDNSEFWCSGEVSKTSKNIIIKVDKGSYLPEFFSEDYTLTINDYKSFAKICREIPPFTLIAFLYHFGVDVYDGESTLKDKKEPITKLNHPKFYVDKNINTLLLPGTISDLRISSQIMESGLNYCFLKFENELYTKFHLKYDDVGYTTLRNALYPYNLDRELLKNIISIRNFFAHHHILGDNVRYDKKQFQKIDIKFVFDNMYDLITVLETKDPIQAEYLRKNFFYKIIMNLVYMKYFDSYRNTQNLLTTNDLPKLIDTMKKAYLRMKNSYFTRNIEDMIPLFIRNDDVMFNYKEDGPKRFRKIYQTTITSDKNLLLKNGKDTGVKELNIYNFTEPKLNELFEYTNIKKDGEENTELLIKRKYILN